MAESSLHGCQRMLMQCEILLLGVQKSHSRDALKSWVFLVRLFTESWRVTFSCIHTESRSSKLSHKMPWKNVLRRAGGSKARLKNWQIFFRMCGSVMKHTSLYQAMSTTRTLCSGELKHQIKSFRDHCTLWSAQHGLPYQNMA